MWAHDGRVIQDGDGGHPDSDRNVCVEVESPLPGNTRGRLKIHGLRVEDSGTYSCLDKEGAVRPDSIRVVVVDDGECSRYFVIVCACANSVRDTYQHIEMSQLLMDLDFYSLYQ